ncbi:MAG: tRNA (N(6)-L-threonylcarbamoyladenosine(37)-C(2))-methylthiotransferase MtaB [Bacteroidales bacterium]|jgi:threonylcarbamoyladenosine tRNA methylthiotransferase MtaB|nr:tRNA (N(6)-L-threonylcarbamoyladenosine(37)-C(2))-methylthiotransferase MtaB [Bacteroidales bacterium]
MPNQKKIAFNTLGCKLNFAESSDLARKFAAKGYLQTGFHDFADVYVVNTCSVTQIAEKKCRNAIRQASHLNPNAVIAVIGCFAQLRPEQIADIEGVDIILGNEDKGRLIEIVENYNKGSLSPCEAKTALISDIGKAESTSVSFSSDDRTRCFVKVQDGCNYYCSYCTIPFARGRSRSARVAEVVDVVKKVAAEGKKEVVLTGINIGTFGQNNGETFFDLIKTLDECSPIERLRISSIEPNLLSEPMIDFIAQSRAFLPHFHIPLQAGSDVILRAMRRKYDTALFKQRLQYIYSKMPHAFVAADVITGFPGETEEEFAAAKSYIEGLESLSALHVFTYSERPNTFAATLTDKVPHQVRKQRSLILQEISQTKKQQFYLCNRGSQRKVLWEDDNDEGFMFGFTDNYIRVCKPYDAASANRIEDVMLQNLNMERLCFVLGE